ncbi:Uncharacterized protein OBRU01_09703 [Operophtera brumata]|uniref:Uncharacterized protein n=1 Tax=Operophtera brumata TaxID=104452 RepID=A0A0L7LGC6_OPEBR|nr:Uncharacterized protein OBRU01_09703 [Operophtera brumata]
MDTVLKQCDEWPTGGSDVEARLQLTIERHMDTVLKQCDEWPTGGSDVEASIPDGAGAEERHKRRTGSPKYPRLSTATKRKPKPTALRYRTCTTLCSSIPDGAEERRKRRTGSSKYPRLSTATKRKPKPTALSKPHKILQLLKHKAQTTQLLNNIKNDELKEADPPEAFPLEREDNISDTETIVGEKDVDMNQVLAAIAQMALSPDKRIQQAFENLKEEYANAKPSPTDSEDEKYPETVSPPLQEMSPTTSDPMPVYTPKPTQRLIVNKFNDKIDLNAQITPELNVPLNARRTPVLVKEETDKEITTENAEVAVYKDPNIYKYVTFGLEIKKAMEDCQNIINSCNSIKTGDGKEKESENQDGPLSLEQICEVMMSIDKNSAEFLNKIDTDEPIDINTANTKLAELVENMPQILANMPEIASEFANASFELPEFASIMNSLPEVNSEAQLTPETLKQIRELKFSKNRDSVKVTKNTAKRKISRKVKNNIDTSDIIGTMTFEFDSRDITDLLKDEKELQALMKSKTHNKEDFKDLLFSISAQVVINKVFEYLKANKSPELAKCMEEELSALPKNSINSEMYSKASTLFDNSVKDALSMDELRDSVRSRFNTWKHYVANEFKSIPVGLLDNEIEAMLDKFYHYIKDLASKQTQCDRDKIIEKLEDCRKEQDYYDSEEDCAPSKESLKQITKILSVSAGNTFDLLLMKMSRMTGEKRAALKNMRFKYVDVLKRCAESQQLVGWILSDPDLAANHIQELMGFAMRNQEQAPDFSTMAIERKREYFMGRLKGINRHFMDNIPKKSLTGDEWLVMLYRLEQFENKIKEALVKFSPPVKTIQNASEAEILAAKGLSKIIGKANTVKKKPDPVCQPAPAATPVASPAPAPTPAPTPVNKEDKPEPVTPKPKECVAPNTRRGALRNAKQTLNAVAFKNLIRNGQSKSESDISSCDVPSSECKYTSDCMCAACKRDRSVCLGDIVKISFDGANPEKSKNVLEEKKKEVKEVKVKTPAKAKPVPKQCENTTHQQHVCKAREQAESAARQETDQCADASDRHAAETENLTTNAQAASQAQAKRQALDSQQRMLADKMAKMVVTEKPDTKPLVSTLNPSAQPDSAGAGQAAGSRQSVAHAGR